MFFLTLFLIIHIFFVSYCISLRVISNDQAFDWSVESLCCEAKELIAIMLIGPFCIGWWPSLPPLFKQEEPQNTIIFIPGYGLNRLSLWGLKRYLQTCGWMTSWAINLPVLTDDPDQFDQYLHRCINDMHWRSKNQKVILIGHSMGGLVANQYLQKHGISKVAALITIGTPWRGTQLYRLGIGKQTKIFAPQSKHCVAPIPPQCPHLSIWSPRDWIVLPSSNSLGTGFHSHKVSTAGHMSMLFSLEVFHSIRDFLTSLNDDK